MLWSMQLGKRSHHVPDRRPVGAQPGDRAAAERAGPIGLISVGSCQLTQLIYVVPCVSYGFPHGLKAARNLSEASSGRPWSSASG